ncbi:RluA family pseudouridine synthase [Buchnera aphidicola]|nr:RluA family pseudouridine synthase [Buchnera aphidicola]
MKKNYVFSIQKDFIFQRIDNFLFNKFKTLPKSLIYKNLRIGKILINKKKKKPSYKLQKNDIIYLFNIKIEPIKIKKISCNFKIKQKILKNILYEDQHLIILNKPYGFSVHGGSGIQSGIIEIFRTIRTDIKFLELIHRLDKDTSGILLLAKKRSTLKNLHQQLREKKIKKYYISVLHGMLKKQKIIIDLPILKTYRKKKFNIVTIHKNGKPSKTIFLIKKIFSNCTLVIIKPITGRTHQIRIHAAQSGHPVLYDPKYGNSILDSKIKFYKKKRLLLHAYKITFLHPETNKNICIYAPLDKIFKKNLSFFSKK